MSIDNEGKAILKCSVVSEALHAAMIRIVLSLLLALASLAACATHQDIFRDDKMDFSAIQTVAVMPFVNLSRESTAAERVRDVFINRLLATGALYVLPVGEVARGVARAEVITPSAPSPEDIVKLGGILKAQAIITGTVREYGEVRSGTAVANVIAVSAQMVETESGRVVWSSASTKGGITTMDRLFGGGGEPMEQVTEKAVDELLTKLFR
ncbi:MAG TPA: GNA1162 family protein [Syntrophorhabdales bacterium]|nr:GNA1162 family protein [Syntrophorhabdales bacterium]